MTSPPSGHGTSAHGVQRHLDPLIKNHLKFVCLRWPFRQNAVHIAFDLVGRLMPVGMGPA